MSIEMTIRAETPGEFMAKLAGVAQAIFAKPEDVYPPPGSAPTGEDKPREMTSPVESAPTREDIDAAAAPSKAELAVAEEVTVDKPKRNPKAKTEPKTIEGELAIAGDAEVRKAMIDLGTAKNDPAAPLVILKQFGAGRRLDLKPEQFADFIAACNAAAAA